MDIGVTIRGLTSGLTPLCSSDQGPGGADGGLLHAWTEREPQWRGN